MSHKAKLITPHAAVIIWNYDDRVNASGGQNVDKIEQIIINTASLIGISTQKRKSSPAGAFEFRLAPTHNWVSRITPGSWCVMLMSQDKPVPQLSASNLGSADPNLFKMLGRIDSVRVTVGVDQDTGARNTQYVVTGQDWGSVFDTKLYIDPILRNNNFDNLGPIGHSLRIAFDNFITNWADDKKNVLPSSSQVMRAMIDLWGAPVADIGGALADELASGSNPIQLDKNPVFSSEAQFKLPTVVAQYMGLTSPADLLGSSINFSSLIKVFSGVLTSLDTYSGDKFEDQGFPSPDSMYGMHTFWQILTDNCNPVVNELLTDIHWGSNGKPKLVLYKRAKPFINRSSFEGSDDGVVQLSTSKFSYVRRTLIPLEDVIDINAGTNWRDKVNFIEIRPQPQLQQLNFDVQVKVDSQVIDRKAYEREGFKPMIQSAFYMPYQGGEPAPLEAVKWKHLLREWFFNTHLMLNGSMTIIGQNKYIQVGDNVMVDASVFGPSSFNAKQSGQATYMLAHVESISHNFTVDQNGARNFITTIQFVRGVITGENGEILGSSGVGGISGFSAPGGSDLDGALDRNAKDLPGPGEKNTKVFGSSTLTDPDKSKLKGT